MSKAAINIQMQIVGGKHKFLTLLSKYQDVAGSHDKRMPSFIRNCKMSSNWMTLKLSAFEILMPSSPKHGIDSDVK